MSEPRASRPHMPGYGVVAADEGEGLLPWSWARDRLTSARNYFISTVRPDGAPHVMVIWGLWLDERFLFSTDRGSRKARNLAANPRCVITPEDGAEAVIVEGTASELADAAERRRFDAAYQAKYGWDTSENPSPVFAVTPRLVFGQIEKTFTKSATRWQFW
jgi:pyridoxine/pyridoxamine 5'-phosphate oxidase